MRFIAGDRQTGRTTALIEWALAEEPGIPRYIVCHSRDEALRVHREDLKRAEAEGRTPVRMPVTVNELMNLSLRGSRAIFAIDNLELVLSYLVGQQVDIATIPTPEQLETP